MYIGIFDQDLILTPSKFCPSLEIMKISYYHKKKGDIVEFVLSFEDTEKYDILYLSRESLSQKDFPSSFLLQKNLQWVGRGFTGNYVKLPDEIEHSPPDKTFYSTYVMTHKDVFSLRSYTCFTKKILNPSSILLRITNGEKLLIDYTKLNYHNQKIILYDYDFYSSPHAMAIYDYFTSRGNELIFIHKSVIEGLDNFLHICKNTKSITDTYPAVSLIHDDAVPVTKLLKYADCFNYSCGYTIIKKNKPISRKAVICALNLYFCCASLGKKIPISADLTHPEKNIESNDYEKIIAVLSNQLYYNFSPGRDLNLMELIFEKYGQPRCVLINEKIQQDRNLYILLHTNISTVKGTGKWRPRL